MAKLNFSGLLNQSWQWTRKNLRLWWLGLLIGLSGMVFNFRASDLQDAFEQVFKDNSAANLKDFFSNIGNVSALTFGLLIIFVIFALIGFWANASLLFGIRKLKSQEQFKFWTLVKFGFKKMPRLLLLEIIFSIPFYAFLIPIIVYLMFIMNQILSVLFAICFVLFIVYIVFVALFKPYAYCFAIIDDQPAWPSITAAFNLLKNNFWNFILARLIQIGLWLAIAIGISILILILMLLLALFGMILSLGIGDLATAIISTLSGIIGLLAIFLVRAGANVFFQGFLAGVYWEVKGK